MWLTEARNELGHLPFYRFNLQVQFQCRPTDCYFNSILFRQILDSWFTCDPIVSEDYIHCLSAIHYAIVYFATTLSLGILCDPIVYGDTTHSLCILCMYEYVYLAHCTLLWVRASAKCLHCEL